MSAITIAGDLIHYEKLGRGRPVLLVHGWIGSWRYWIPVMQTLHLSFTVYTLDLIGFGDSAKNEAHYDIESQVNMLEQFMDRLGLPKAAIIGHGLGAMVVSQFALKNPTKAARLMLTSLPLFDPGDLKERVPAGTRQLLTGGNKRYSLAPSIEEVMGSDPQRSTEYYESTIPSGEVSAASSGTDHIDLTLQRPPGKLTSNHTNSDHTAVAGSSDSAFHEMPTISPASIDREALRKAAEVRDVSKNVDNPLMNLFKDHDTQTLLERCFKKTEPAFEKLKADVDRSDAKVLVKSAEGYEAGKMLDNLRRITAPVVAIHGLDDPVLPAPSDEIWQYLTLEKDDVFVPIPLPNVRHFPMLEHETFPRLAKDFLEVPEINKLEVREVWKRRHF